MAVEGKGLEVDLAFWRTTGGELKGTWYYQLFGDPINASQKLNLAEFG